MPRLKIKKTSVSSVLREFRYNQPFIGFRTQFRTVSIKGKTKARTHTINYGASCREELVWDTREAFETKITERRQKSCSWEIQTIPTQTLDLDHPSLKQPEKTYLWFDTSEGYDDSDGSVCKRACCLHYFTEVLDAIVGPIAVLLNPDRYVGDWWTTASSEASKGKEIRWYGTDNFFLRHPILVSVMMGMFRQGILLDQQDFSEAILKAVQRKDVEDCLTNADPVLAMRLMRALRPWIEVEKWQTNFTFGQGYWDRLGLLHRAIYKYGYDVLFDGNPQESWNIAPGHSGRHDISNGPFAYWGGPGKKVTKAGKRLAKLGK